MYGYLIVKDDAKWKLTYVFISCSEGPIFVLLSSTLKSTEYWWCKLLSMPCFTWIKTYSDTIWHHRCQHINIGSDNGMMRIWHLIITITWTNANTLLKSKCQWNLNRNSFKKFYLKMSYAACRAFFTVLKSYLSLPFPVSQSWCWDVCNY